jgi:ADP-ribosyl-[dinitrogen reductase] hydrolase
MACLTPSRLRACLLAGALGDALGGPSEGADPNPGRGLPEGPLQVSDDTLLVLATCRGIARAGRVDPAAIAGAFVEAYRAGLPGVGSSTLKALRDLDAGLPWALAGARGEYAAGNGGAMRVAPLAFFGDPRDESFRRLVRDVVDITHRHDEAVAAALAVVDAMHALAETPDEGRAALLHRVAERQPDTPVADSLLALATLPEGAGALDAARISGTSGRARDSVPLALFLAASPGAGMPAAWLDAIRCGGDTDTVASLVGQLLAARGREPPAEWGGRLACLDEIDALSRALATLTAGAKAPPQREERLPWPLLVSAKLALTLARLRRGVFRHVP